MDGTQSEVQVQLEVIGFLVRFQYVSMFPGSYCWSKAFSMQVHVAAKPGAAAKP